MVRALLSAGFVAFAASAAPGQTGDVYVVTGKIAAAVDGDKVVEDYTFGQTLTVIKTKAFNNATWAKVTTKQGGAWIDTASLRSLQPLVAGVNRSAPYPPEIAKLFNDYFAPDENYKNNISSPALKVIIEDAAKTKTLIGSLDFNLKRLKEAKIADLTSDEQKPLTEAIANYETFARGVKALDKLARISDDEYTAAWLKDAGLGIFIDVVLPALDVVYPGAGTAAKGVANASGIREEFRADKYYIKSLKDFRAKTLAATLQYVDRMRSAGTNIWLARSHGKESVETPGLAVDLRQYRCQAHLGYHGVSVVNAFDKPLTNAFIQVTIKGDKREEGHAYYSAAEWKPGQTILLKCDPKGIEVDKQAFGKTSVAAPSTVTVEVMCDQSDKILTAAYAHDEKKARQDLALFLREDAKVGLSGHTYVTKVLVGTGPNILCSFVVDWPDEVAAEVGSLRNLEVSMAVMSGDTVLNQVTDTVATYRASALTKGGPILVARDNLGPTKPDAIIFTVKPEGVVCVPKAMRYAIEIK